VTLAGPVFHAKLGLRALRAAAGAGLLSPTRPDRLVRMAAAPLRLGLGPATIVAAAAARHPDQVALVDERGALTYEQLDRRAAAVAVGLSRELGVGPDGSLAVMCRNHRGFVEALLAGSRCGADLLLLNTEFSGPQLGEVVEREQPGAVVHDEEYHESFEEAGLGDRRFVAWHDGDPGTDRTLEALTEEDPGGAPSSRRQGKLVLLTSGTTGTPKGAPRKPSLRAVIGPATALLSEVPVRAREPMLIGPPFFHGFGFAYLVLALSLGSTVVMRRRFDPEAALAAIEQRRATAFVGVPAMHQRILQLPEEVRRRHDTASLRALISAAAPLSSALAEGLLQEFGDVLYNLYGSTETGFGAIAGPADLSAAPDTVGRPPPGTTLKILDDDGSPLGPGDTGHVFVGGGLVFEGYSGGGSKDTVDGLMNTGDLGHLDDEGRLFIDGREDDMIVSGGENVFPAEVEDVLARHDGVEDVAVIGVEDDDFGQRLRAYVVAGDGAELSEDQLKEDVKANLARYKVPRDVVFVDEVPRNPTGKQLKSELP
jgi:acyl-CoA synthetase (AMP-forming)/AMP-acid ligase II